MKTRSSVHTSRRMIPLGSGDVPGFTEGLAAGLLGDPEGLAAIGGEVPSDPESMKAEMRRSLRSGVLLWRIEMDGDSTAGLVGENPFDRGRDPRIVVWLDPRHRGMDLGMTLVSEAMQRLRGHGRARLTAEAPGESYPALRILNRLGFIYLGCPDGTSGGRVRFEHRGRVTGS